MAAFRNKRDEVRSSLQVYNTMSRSTQPFTPREDGIVKMFTCGPSIYQRPHVGNFRTFLFEDVLLRYLEYRGYTVKRIINFTDVEDKSIAEAQREGKSVEEVTDRTAERFFEDSRLLKLKLPSHIPRSSTTVPEAVQLIKTLLDRGYAYWDKGDVFFEPLKFKGFGKLFRLDMSKWPKKPKRFRKDTYPGRQWNLGDFVLWHGYRDGDPIHWDTEIGKGRPSWNIQDPAIIAKHLGFEVDVSCGGIDNIYRHHDYTIAIMESISGREHSRYWMHGEHLLVGGKKMSKSVGNIVYVDDLLKGGVRPEHIRFYLTYGHYRKKLNLTERGFAEASAKLDSFLELLQELRAEGSGGGRTPEAARELISAMASSFERHMNDDLDFKSAFDSIFETVSMLVSHKREGRLAHADIRKVDEELMRIDTVLQVMQPYQNRP